MPSQQPPFCPACGYLRTGIDHGSKCPECGTDGLDAWFVIVGGSRLSRSANSALAIGLGMGVLMLGAAVVGRFGFQSIGLIVIALVLAALVVVVRTVLFQKGKGDQAARPIIWSAHPAGLAIRERDRTEFIPRADIASIDHAESLFGSMSVIRVVRRRASLKGLVGSTPYIFVRGTKPDRMASLMELRRILGMG